MPECTLIHSIQQSAHEICRIFEIFFFANNLFEIINRAPNLISRFESIWFASLFFVITFLLHEPSISPANDFKEANEPL